MIHCRNDVQCAATRTVGAKLIFKRSELIYDAANCSFVASDVNESGNLHLKHQMADIAEKGNVDEVTRILNRACSECVEMLFPYSRRPMPEVPMELDDTLVAPEQYVIELELPETFSVTTVHLLSDLIHDYMVFTVLSRWFHILGDGKARTWEAWLQDTEQRIRSSLLQRTKRVRRKTKPF